MLYRERHVKDAGHAYSGRMEIARWKREPSAKYKYTSEPIKIEEVDGTVIVTSHLVGDFPGGPIDLRYFFRLEDGGIAVLETAL